MKDTVRHIINLVSKNKEYDNLSELIETVLKPNKTSKQKSLKNNIQEIIPTVRRSRKRKVKDDPNQLKIPFVFEE